MALPAHVIAFFKSANTAAAQTAIGAQAAGSYRTGSDPVLVTAAEIRVATQAAARFVSPLLLAPAQGTTAARPTDATVGYVYFDTTLGKPVFLKTVPSAWVDATGITA